MACHYQRLYTITYIHQSVLQRPPPLLDHAVDPQELAVEVEESGSLPAWWEQHPLQRLPWVRGNVDAIAA